MSPPGKAAFVASNETFIASRQVPPIPCAFISTFEWVGSSIGKEYPERRWPTQTPSFLQVVKYEYKKWLVISQEKEILHSV